MKSFTGLAWESLKTLGVILIAAAPPVAIGYFGITFYQETFDESDISLEHDRWGTFGDFLGGIINPVVGIITIILLVLTLMSQRRELKEQRNQMALAAFEQTFFTWLNTYRDLVNRFRYLYSRMPEEVRYGIDGLEQATKDTNYRSNAEAIERSAFVSRAGGLGPTTSRGTYFSTVAATWRRVYSKSEPQLGAMLRTLFTLIRWVDKNPALTAQQKWDYVAIVRAQLSSPELRILFFNGFMPPGQAFTQYVDKYALLDNLLHAEHWDIVAAHTVHAHPFAESAFHSNLARSKLGISVSS